MITSIQKLFAALLFYIFVPNCFCTYDKNMGAVNLYNVHALS